MKRPALKPQPPPLKIGDYVARNLWGSDWHVALKTGPGFAEEKRVCACATECGARELAKQMNEVRDLSLSWRNVVRDCDLGDGSHEKWSKGVIAHMMMEAIGVKVDLDHPWRFNLVSNELEEASTPEKAGHV